MHQSPSVIAKPPIRNRLPSLAKEVYGDSSIKNMAAVLVVFDLSKDPHSVIGNVLETLGRVVVAANSAGGHPALAAWRDDPRVEIIHHRNRGGLAGAYSAALLWLQTQGSVARSS